MPNYGDMVSGAWFDEKTAEQSPAYAAAKKRAETDKWTKQREYEWDTRYAPIYQEKSDLLNDAMNKAIDQEMARQRMQLGYSQSAGYGGSGMWDRAKVALGQTAMGARADAAQQSQDMILQGQLGFMQNKDAVSAQQQQLALQYDYNRRLAEMNDPSWWEQAAGVVGGVAGMAGGLTGLPINGIGDIYRTIRFQF